MIIESLQDTKLIYKNPVAFLYISNKEVAFKVKKTVPYTLELSKIKQYNSMYKIYMRKTTKLGLKK